MPTEINTTGFEKRIAEAAPALSRSKVQRLALKITKRMQASGRFADAPPEAVYEVGLRILGIHRDETARDAVLGHAA